MEKEKKTKAILIRLTESEYKNLKQRAQKYNGRVSHLFKFAIAQLDDEQARNRLNVMKEYISFFKENDSEIRRIAANFNQAVKRLNEVCAYGNFDKVEAATLLREVVNVRETIEKYNAALATFSHQIKRKPKKGNDGC